MALYYFDTWLYFNNNMILLRKLLHSEVTVQAQPHNITHKAGKDLMFGSTFM